MSDPLLRTPRGPPPAKKNGAPVIPGAANFAEENTNRATRAPALASGPAIFERRPAVGRIAFCDQQVFGERPLRVDPLRLASKAGCGGSVRDLVHGIFVAAFGPDGFALKEFNL